MGGRDYRRREPKKPKKGAKKAVITSVIQSPAAVEVIKKKRKPKELREAEEE
jgi:hypothetical protein